MTNQRQNPSFNLCTEAWLPAMYLDGSVREISLKTAFEEAGSIKELSGDIPEQVLPFYRMMLAILYRAYPLPEGDDRKALLDTWKEVWHAGKFDMESIGQYIDYFKDRFDLFDSEHPFYQTPGLVYAGKDSDGVGELVADVPKDDKYLFAMRDKGTLESLSFAEAARWLVFSNRMRPQESSQLLSAIRMPSRGKSMLRRVLSEPECSERKVASFSKGIRSLKR